MSCYIDVVGCTNNDDHNGIDKGDCPYCEIDRLTAQLAEANERCRLLDEKAGDWQHRYTQETMRLQSQLAERDKLIEDQQAEIADCSKFNFELQQANAALRAEVEKLDDLLSNTRKQTAQEIIQYIIDQGKVAFGSLSARDYVYDIIDSDIEELRQRYGLEG